VPVSLVAKRARVMSPNRQASDVVYDYAEDLDANLVRSDERMLMLYLTG
jgi:hypothetical protein